MKRLLGIALIMAVFVGAFLAVLGEYPTARSASVLPLVLVGLGGAVAGVGLRLLAGKFETSPSSGKRVARFAAWAAAIAVLIGSIMRESLAGPSQLVVLAGAGGVALGTAVAFAISPLHSGRTSLDD